MQFSIILTALSLSGIPTLAQDTGWDRHYREGNRLAAIASYPAAEREYRAAVEAAAPWGEQDSRLWKTLDSLALVRQQQGFPADAVEIYTRVGELRATCLGAGHRDVAVSWNNLGVALRLASRPLDAEPIFRKALLLAEHWDDSRLLATILAGLGATLVDRAEFARAEPVLRRSRAVFEGASGPDSLETAEAANNLAMLYRRTGQMSLAEGQLARALPLMEKHLGAGHPALAIALNSMFVVLAEQQEWDRAEPYLRRALAIGQQVFPGSAQMAEIDQNLAILNAHRSLAAKHGNKRARATRSLP